MVHSLKFRITSLGIILVSLLINPATFSAQNPVENSFTIDNDTYFLHPIASLDLRDTDPDKYDWNQTIISDRKYIYLADHTESSYDQLVIKRFNALDGTPEENLIIEGNEMERFGLTDLEEEQLFFYLVDSKSDDYFVLFPNPPYDGISKTSPYFSFYLIDKTGGHIEREFYVNNIKNITSFTNSLSFFGIPDFKGDMSTGNFDMFLPMLDELGHLWIGQFVFENNRLKSNSTVFQSNDFFSRPSVKIIDDNFMIIDDDRIYPSLYSYSSNNNYCYGTLDQHHINAHGFGCFNFDGHRLIYSGDIQTDGDIEKTYFNIGLWDTPTVSTASTVLQSSSTLSFSDYKYLCSIQFGESTHKVTLPSYYTYRQQMAVSDYGDSVKHLHFYVPGEFLATYQLNKQDIPTGISGLVTDCGKLDINISISGKRLMFDQSVGDIYVFNSMGTMIYNSVPQVNTIDLSEFSHGLYIIKTDKKSFKISI